MPLAAPSRSSCDWCCRRRVLKLYRRPFLCWSRPGLGCFQQQSVLATRPRKNFDAVARASWRNNLIRSDYPECFPLVQACIGIGLSWCKRVAQKVATSAVDLCFLFGIVSVTLNFLGMSSGAKADIKYQTGAILPFVSLLLLLLKTPGPHDENESNHHFRNRVSMPAAHHAARQRG